jgi:hypothetical protein
MDAKDPLAASLAGLIPAFAPPASIPIIALRCE